MRLHEQGAEGVVAGDSSIARAARGPHPLAGRPSSGGLTRPRRRFVSWSYAPITESKSPMTNQKELPMHRTPLAVTLLVAVGFFASCSNSSGGNGSGDAGASDAPSSSSSGGLEGGSASGSSGSSASSSSGGSSGSNSGSGGSSGSSSGSGSGNSSGSSGGGHAFACGTMTCNSTTQYCSVVEYGHAILPDGGQGSSQVSTCTTVDGGPSCSGSSSAVAGGCGCYESPTGEVTITECTP